MHDSLKAEMKFAPAPFFCLYACECSTFLLPLPSCCLLLLPELGNTYAKVVCFLFCSLRGRNGTTTCKGVHQKSAHPLQTMKTCTQMDNFKFYSRLNFNMCLGQTANSALVLYHTLCRNYVYRTDCSYRVLIWLMLCSTECRRGWILWWWYRQIYWRSSRN